jgi:phosphoenolpyruvate carboxylase
MHARHFALVGTTWHPVRAPHRLTAAGSQATLRQVPSSGDPLRDQVRLLGQILGETVAELHGPSALDLVEGTRRAAVALRQRRLPGGREALAATVASRTLEEIELLASAFTDFFLLINAAEEQHRIRVLRDRDRPDSPPDGSSAAAAREMRDAGATAGDVQALLDRLLVR